MKLGLLNKIFYIINMVFAAALLMSYFAPITHPSSFWVISIFGLLYPYLLFFNFLFVLYWLFSRKIHLLLSLIIILFGYKNIFHTIGFTACAGAETGIKVMSYNVKNFDLYNWTKNELSRDDMLMLIQDENPDIIAFQEFYTEETDHFHNVKRIINDLGFVDYHFEKSLTLDGNKHWGLAIFSKYPILNKNTFKFDDSRHNMFTYVDLQIEDRIVRVFNAHLQSFHFEKKDYKFFDVNEDAQEKNWETSKSILMKLKSAFEQRAHQAEQFNTIIDKTIYPVIVLGDFNDTPISYTYNSVKGDLQDAFLCCGSGFSSTYNGPLPAMLRIDYIFADKQFEVQSYKRIKQGASDHYPVTAVIDWEE